MKQIYKCLKKGSQIYILIKIIFMTSLGKSTMQAQELKSLLLTNLVATFMLYPDTTID